MTEAEKDNNPSPLREMNALMDEAIRWLYGGLDPEEKMDTANFLENVLNPAWEAVLNGATGSDFFANVTDDESLIGEARGIAAYFAEVQSAFRDGRHDLAWKLVAEASWHAGVVRGLLVMTEHDPVRENARKAATARHAESREIAGRIQAWYAENHHRYRSKDAAAEAVTRVEPVAFKTARKHVGAAAKNLPSARKE